MEDKIDVARVNLHVLLSSLFFQEVSLDCIFSMMKWKLLLLGLPFNIGNHKYLSRDVVLRIPEMFVMLLIFP